MNTQNERERIIRDLVNTFGIRTDGVPFKIGNAENIADWHLAEVKRIVANTKISTLESIMVRGAPAYLITDFDDMPIEHKTFGVVIRKSIDEIKRESEANNDRISLLKM
jgi:hypothetical protein